MAIEERIDKLNQIKSDVIDKINNLASTSMKDLEINDIDLDRALIDTPKLFSKYNNMYTDEMVNFRTLIVQKDKVFLERQKWMMGKQTNKYYADYGTFNEKVLKSELDIYMKVDPIYSLLNEIVSLQKIYIDSIEKICSEVKNRGYHIKSVIEWRKFTSGA